MDGMNRTPTDSKQTDLWFWLGMTGIFVMSVGLRFWELGRFNTLVFDEIYYVTFASDYFKGIPTFGGHPPFSFYPVAIAIWIAQHTPIGDGDIKNGLAGMMLSPISYRWLNAVVGACLPVAVAGLAYQITHRRRYALIAALLVALDGMFLVDSRYALNNNYLILFGVLGHQCALRGVNQSTFRGQSLSLSLSGIFFGLSVAVKWNGLGFLLGLYLCWLLIKGRQGYQALVTRLSSINRSQIHYLRNHRPPNNQSNHLFSPIVGLARLNIGHVLLYLGAIPMLSYLLSWIPFMRLDPSISFWDWQGEIIRYHSDVGGMEAHPYCSPWYSWPVMWRPIAYFYRTAHGIHDPPPIIGPPLPAGFASIVYDVHAMANPVLLWLSTAAMLLIIGMLIRYSWLGVRRSRLTQPLIRWFPTLQFGSASPQSTTASGWVAVYLGVNYLANWLPWMLSSRCTFFYHYMEAMTFAILAIAWFIDRWFHSRPSHRIAGIAALSLIAIAFVFWLPVYLGLPLSPEAFRWRLWFSSWV
ncbi:MAG: phospholipid carrier-dependent glycosyltransferase [Elainellaceae cyanobacterium]